MEISDLVQRFSDTPQHQRKAIFSQLMIAATRLQTVFDQEIPQVTLKQFMLLTIVRQSDSELTLTEAGKLLGCSRQNVKKLAEALERLGCTVRREASPGVPAFRTGRGGFRLLAEDEEGEPLPPEQLLTIVALIEYEDGAGRVAVPDAAPAAIDTLAAGYHGGALRLGRDGPEAEARYGELPWLRDALFAACRICAHLGMTGERLHGLAGKIPRFVLRRREVSLRSGQGEVLSVLLRTLPGAQPAGGGLRVRPWPAAPFCGSWERPAAPSWPRSCAPSVPAGRRRPTGACRKNRGILFRKGMVY